MKYLALAALLALPGCRGVLCLVCMEPLYPKVEPDAGMLSADAGSPTFPYIWDDAIIPTEAVP